MHDELKDRLKKLENDYNGKEFMSIVNKVKTDKINDDELLAQIENISLKRFREKVSLNLGLSTGNILEFIVAAAAVFLAFKLNSDLMLYICALILMTTLHPLSHYLAGLWSGIGFTHYYLNGPARIEPTIRIDYSSYLKVSGKKRAFMHVSGVIGTLAAPLITAFISLEKGIPGVAVNMVYFFLLLIVFELLTSTRIGDLMEAKREYRYH